MLKKFIAYLWEQLNRPSIYVWGAQGQTGSQITEAWIRQREKGTGGYKDKNKKIVLTYADAAVALWKKYCKVHGSAIIAAYDCSGLGVHWLKDVAKLITKDCTANTLYGMCKKKLTRATVKAGDWVFRGSAVRKTHIGYVVDDKGTVIEAKGRQDGVVTSNAREVYWQYFARPNLFAAEIEGTQPIPPTTKKQIEVIGGSVYIRLRDNATGAILKTARKGERYPYNGDAPSGWYMILVDDTPAFISNRSDLTRLV